MYESYIFHKNRTLFHIPVLPRSYAGNLLKNILKITLAGKIKIVADFC